MFGYPRTPRSRPIHENLTVDELYLCMVGIMLSDGPLPLISKLGRIIESIESGGIGPGEA